MPRISQVVMLGAVSSVVSANPCRSRHIVGSWDGAAEAWLQCFDAVSLPSDAAVPVMAWQVPAGSNFEFDFSHDFLLGCVFCFSSTGPTKTISTGAGNVGNLTIDGYFDSTKTQVIVGDLTTGVDSLEIWTDANGPQELTNLTIVSSSATAAYALLFTAAASAGNVPLRSWAVPAGATLSLDFGDGGWIPERCPTSTAKTMTDGCYIYMSSTGNILTATSATEFVIKAIHL